MKKTYSTPHIEILAVDMCGGVMLDMSLDHKPTDPSKSDAPAINIYDDVYNDGYIRHDMHSFKTDLWESDEMKGM